MPRGMRRIYLCAGKQLAAGVSPERLPGGAENARKILRNSGGIFGAILELLWSHFGTQNPFKNRFENQ